MRKIFVYLLCGLLFLSAAVPARATASSAPDGKALYAEHCARCHRPLEKSTMGKRRASRIESAIRVFPAMYTLSVLSKEEVEAIATVLAQVEID